MKRTQDFRFQTSVRISVGFEVKSVAKFGLTMPKDIVIQPTPVWNVSCLNDKVWNSLEILSTVIAVENIAKFVCLLVLSLGTIATNIIFVLVLMNRRYNKNIFPQARYIYIYSKYKDFLIYVIYLYIYIYIGYWYYYIYFSQDILSHLSAIMGSFLVAWRYCFHCSQT